MLGEARRSADDLLADGQPERETVEQQAHASHIRDKRTNRRYPSHHRDDGFASPLLRAGMLDIGIRVHARRMSKCDATRRQVAVDAISLYATSLRTIAGCTLRARLTK